MPELPEVEVTRRALASHVLGKTLTEVIVRTASLREPLDTLGEIEGLRLRALERRSKVLVWTFEGGCRQRTWLASHMGMSGSWRVYDRPGPEPCRHEHVDLVFEDVLLRYRDPRRFGSMRVSCADPRGLPPLSLLGPEPFDASLTEESFAAALKTTHRSIKQVLMDGRAVVGCGNIYANEALFAARIRPDKPSDKVTRAQAARLLAAVRSVLEAAIEAGGSTLRDFHGPDGASGWFALQTHVYDCEGEPCSVCGTPVRRIVLGQRSTYYCPKCQK